MLAETRRRGSIAFPSWSASRGNPVLAASLGTFTFAPTSTVLVGNAVISLHWAGTATLSSFADPNGTANRWDILTQHTANGCGVALLLGQITTQVTTGQSFVATFSVAATDRGACIANLTVEPQWGAGPLAPVGTGAAVTTLQVIVPIDANGGRHMTLSAFTRTVPAVTSTAGGAMTNRFDLADGTLRMVQQTRNLSDGSSQFPQITWVGAGNVVGVATNLRAEPQPVTRATMHINATT